MGIIRFDSAAFDKAVGSDDNISQRLDLIADELKVIGKNTGSGSINMAAISRSVLQEREAVLRQRTSARSMSEYLAGAASRYTAAERKLAGKVNDSEAERKKKIRELLEFVRSVLFPWLFFKPGRNGPGIIDTVKRFLLPNENDPYYNEESKDAKGKTTLWKHENKESKYSHNKEDLDKSKLDPLLVYGIRKKKKSSLKHWETDDGNASADVFKRELYGQLYGGLFVKGEDGNKKLAPGFGAAAGYTIALLSGEAGAETDFGTDGLFGVGVKAEGAAGKAEVKGDVNIGLTDGEGHFNPAAHGKVSAEAIAVEGSVTGSATILGTEMGVKASGNVGIGGHFEAGFQDGKFSMDVGASFGLGASVKLEIDINGTVNAVCDGVRAVWDNIRWW